MENKKAILPSILLTILLLLSITTISIRLPYKNHSLDNDFIILVTRNDVDIKIIEKYGYKEAFRVL